jgi:hypothetical protein
VAVTRRLDPRSRDFDFLHGSWKVEHRRLRTRLVGSDDWVAFVGTAECHPVLDGVGNVDQIAQPAPNAEGLPETHPRLSRGLTSPNADGEPGEQIAKFHSPSDRTGWHDVAVAVPALEDTSTRWLAVPGCASADERAALLDREHARFAGGNRQVGRCTAR